MDRNRIFLQRNLGKEDDEFLYRNRQSDLDEVEESLVFDIANQECIYKTERPIFSYISLIGNCLSPIYCLSKSCFSGVVINLGLEANLFARGHCFSSELCYLHTHYS